MKNLKKLLAVIVAICVLATFTVPAFAEEAVKTDAEICEALEVLKGTTSGVDADYLAKGTQRYQAAIITLRLAGKETEALAFEGTDNFDDAAELEYTAGRAALAYLKANPELGWAGSTSGKFFPYGEASAQMIYKVLLESLGYKQGAEADFTWDGVIEFAAEKGLVKVADVAKLTNNDVAIAIVEALKAKVKDSEATLAETLVEAGAIDKAAAIEAGLYSDELTATVAATGAKKLTVTFGQAVDSSKVTFVAKKGAVSANIKEVTFDKDKKSAVLEMAGALTEGTYTVTVKGLEEELTLSVDVLDEKVTKIEFASETASLVRDEAGLQITVGYKVYNQYSEDISENEGVNVTAGKGAVASNPVSGGTITLESLTAYTIGEKVNVTIVHAQTGSYVSSVLTVGTEARAASIALTSIYHPDDEELVAGETENFYIVVEAKDQYGNVMEVPATVKEDVMVTVSNPSVADVDRADAVANLTTEGDNKVVLKVVGKSGTGSDEYTAGTSTVSLISKTTGNRATFDIVVKEGVKVDTFTMTAPAVFAAGDEDIEIPFTAVDQFGNAVVKNLADKGITFTAPTDIDVKFVKNYVTGNDKLTISDDRGSPTDGTIVISALTGTQKYVTLSISVKKAAVPSVVAGIKDFDKVYAIGATATMSVEDNVIINDQYGREIDLGAYTVKVETSAADKVSVDSADADGAEFEGKAKGTSTITLSLLDGTPAAVKNSAYTFTARTVEKADIASFEIAEIGKMYHISDSEADESDIHAVSLKVNGVLADGSKVVVPETGFYTVTENDTQVSYAGGKFESVTGATFDEDGLREVAFVVTVDAPNGGALVGKLVISNKAPAIDKMELQDDATSGAKKESDTSVSVPVGKLTNQSALNTIAADVIKSTDQYGVEIDTTITGNAIVTNATDGHTFGAFVAGDTFKVTVITDNNKVLTFTVIVVE